MKPYLKKTYRWLKRNWKYIVTIIGITVLIILIYGFVNDRDLIEKLRVKASLYKNEKDIAYLEGKRAVIKSNIDHVDEDLVLIDEKIASIKAEAKENIEKIKKMSPEEKLDRFEELGY